MWHTLDNVLLQVSIDFVSILILLLNRQKK